MTLTFLFLLPLCLTLFGATAHALLLRWSGQQPLFLPVLLPAFLIGVAAALLLRKLAQRRGKALLGPRASAWVMVALALCAFAALGDLAAEVKAWLQVGLGTDVSFAAWRRFVLGRAWLWLAPMTAALPVLWCEEGRARGRLALFFGACCGLILAQGLVGRLPTQALLDTLLCSLMALAPLYALWMYRAWWARGLCALVLIVLVRAWYGASSRIPEEPLEGINPFAPIAARDSLYTGRGTKGVLLREGRLLFKEGMDQAARMVSRLIPTLLKPAPNARIACRAQFPDEPPLLATYETGKLAGLYDAIWVELPPAWLPEERKYFGAGALKSAAAYLKPDGVLVYELDAHAFDATMLFERLGLLQATFPHLQLWCTGPGLWQIVASRAPIRVGLEALSAIADRPEVAQRLAQAGVGAPITLLSACLVDDAAKLQATLAEPIAAKLPRREPTHARALLFNRGHIRELCAAFAEHMDAQMPWFAVPPALVADLDPVLQVLRQGRMAALRGDYAKAAEINGRDPFLRALADRELSTARAWEALAEHDKALASYLSAFKLAQPLCADLLACARIAQASATPERAQPLYDLAEAYFPDTFAYLAQYARYLYENKRYAQAEPILGRALEAPASSDAHTELRFLLALTLAHLPERRAEGIALARATAEQVLASGPEAQREHYAIAYGDLLIEAGLPREGVQAKRYFQAYGTLPPEEK